MPMASAYRPALHDNLVKSHYCRRQASAHEISTESPRVLQGTGAQSRIGFAAHCSNRAGLERNFAESPGAKSNADATRTASLLDAHNRRVQAALNSLPDANQLMAAVGHLRDRAKVAEAVIEQDNSDEVVIHLARHPDMLAELNRMSPTAAAAKVGRLAAEIEAKKREAARNRKSESDPRPN